MCFIILKESLNPSKYKAQRRRKVAYKIVTLTRTGQLQSLYMGKRWWVGEHLCSQEATYTHAVGSTQSYARAGIYVYTSLAVAENELFKYKCGRRRTGWTSIWSFLAAQTNAQYIEPIILKVQVKGSDLLYLDNHSRSRQYPRMATYKKVIVPEKQPYIEFYE